MLPGRTATLRARSKKRVNYLRALSLLLDRLKNSAPARVVTVSSNVQAIGRIDFEDLQGERSYSGARAYNQSKLANVLFTYELARRLQATSVTANALHPGVVRTSFGAEDPSGVQRLFTPLMRPFMKAPGRGAATSNHLASALDLEQVTGRYFASSKPRRSSRRSYDQAAAPAAARDMPCRDDHVSRHGRRIRSVEQEHAAHPASVTVMTSFPRARPASRSRIASGAWCSG
jgi:short chain dehydrogenase